MKVNTLIRIIKTALDFWVYSPSKLKERRTLKIWGLFGTSFLR